jgi:hypothetical protein
MSGDDSVDDDLNAAVEKIVQVHPPEEEISASPAKNHAAECIDLTSSPSPPRPPEKKRSYHSLR